MFPNGFFGNVLSKYEDGVAVSEKITGKDFFICLCAALLIGFLISMVYILSHRKEGYSQSYVMTMIMLPSIVCIILLTINSLAGALSVAGAFSLVRFRSVAGDPKDISFIFFAMAAGVACGVGYVGFGICFFAVLGIVMYVLSVTDFGRSAVNHMTLKITIPEDLDYQGVFDPVLRKYTQFHKLRRVKTTNFGTLFELIYSVEVKEDINQKAFLDELRALNGNMTINLVFFRYDDKIYES